MMVSQAVAGGRPSLSGVDVPAGRSSQSLNEAHLAVDLLDDRAFALIEAQLILLELNRPGFPRHFPGSVNVASQTLPVTAGC